METLKGQEDIKSLNLILLRAAAVRKDTRAQEIVRGQRSAGEREGSSADVYPGHTPAAGRGCIPGNTRRCLSAATNSVWAGTLAHRFTFHLPDDETPTFTQQDSDSPHWSAHERHEISLDADTMPSENF